MIDTGRLQVLLGQTKLNRENNALFQLLRQLIDNTGDINQTVNQITGGGGGIGSGNVTGPVISVDGQIALFDGPTGKLLKVATGSGVVHTASGVYSASPIIETDQSLSDVTTQNVSSTKHGYAPKSPADVTQFLNGATTPAFAQVKDSDLSLSDITTNNVSTTKHGFIVKLPNNKYQLFDGVGNWTLDQNIGYWSPLTNGLIGPDLIYDSFGDTIAVWNGL